MYRWLSQNTFGIQEHRTLGLSADAVNRDYNYCYILPNLQIHELRQLCILRPSVFRQLLHGVGTCGYGS